MNDKQNKLFTEIADCANYIVHLKLHQRDTALFSDLLKERIKQLNNLSADLLLTFDIIKD